MNSEGVRDIYLPEGDWVDFFTGEQWQGSRWHYGAACPLERIPVFVRRGTRIPLYPEDVQSTDQMDLSLATITKIDGTFKGITL